MNLNFLQDDHPYCPSFQPSPNPLVHKYVHPTKKSLSVLLSADRSVRWSACRSCFPLWAVATKGSMSWRYSLGTRGEFTSVHLSVNPSPQGSDRGFVSSFLALSAPSDSEVLSVLTSRWTDRCRDDNFPLRFTEHCPHLRLLPCFDLLKYSSYITV